MGYLIGGSGEGPVLFPKPFLSIGDYIFKYQLYIDRNRGLLDLKKASFKFRLALIFGHKGCWGFVQI